MAQTCTWGSQITDKTNKGKKLAKKLKDDDEQLKQCFKTFLCIHN